MLRNVARELEQRRQWPTRALHLPWGWRSSHPRRRSSHLIAPTHIFSHSLHQIARRYSTVARGAELSRPIPYSQGSERAFEPQASRSRSNWQTFQYATPSRTKGHSRAGDMAKKFNRSTDTGKSATKPLEFMKSSQILQKVLEGDSDSWLWKRRVAKFRSVRLPIVLLQEYIRQEESNFQGRDDVRGLLPTSDEMKTILNHPILACYSREVLDYYLYVLKGRNDDERCQRYLENKAASVPLFIFNFLVRSSSSITDPRILHDMIESCHVYVKVDRMSQESRHYIPDSQARSDKAMDIAESNFIAIMRRLVRQCLRLEPRFVVKLARIASEHIQAIKNHPAMERKTYLMQCRVFNRCLQILRPQRQVQAVQRSVPNAYFWEAQRILLSMSAGLDKPLLVDRDGFRAIRDVLSGQSKNHTEMHSATRHAPTWPPYLQPGDGMDEDNYPEDNWSRAVSAGMLMQEAGFAKEELDDAIDILQGMSIDGTPTIQQRSSIGSGRDIGVWEASIRATRNAQEAWNLFRNPPEADMEPRSQEYAAMFEKLVLREVDPESKMLPGDKALNFPTEHEANLAEFERARLRPPSISELYQRMRLSGVPLENSCLRILVANAESLETAHQYLRDSSLKGWIVRNLMSHAPDPNILKMIPISLFASYIQICLRVEGRRGNNQLLHAVRLAELRLTDEHSRWVPFIWGMILKGLGQHHRALRTSFPQQLSLIMRVSDVIERGSGVQLPAFTQFNKCVRKAVKREVNGISRTGSELKDKSNNAWLTELYYPPSTAALDSNTDGHEFVAKVKSEDEANSVSETTIDHLHQVGVRMKNMFQTLAQEERDAQRHLDKYQISPLDRMISRKDPVRSEHALEYMLTLAYLGEFEEMSRLLQWLIEQWGHFEVVSALNELDEPPPWADFFETLCVFRLLAEPILGDDTPSMLLQKLASSPLNWTWPDDEVVKTYAEMHDDESIGKLQGVIEAARKRRRIAQDLLV